MTRPRAGTPGEGEGHRTMNHTERPVGGSENSGESALKRWQAQLQAQLEPDEDVLAWFETDLDPRLFYSPGLVALTPRRLLSVNSTPDGATGAAPRWESWPLTDGVALRTR